VDYVTFSIIVDDLVFHDGHTRMGVIGGGGPQTAFGMRLWSDSVGISASIGEDVPDSILEWIHMSGIDEQGLRRSHILPTPRAWQVIEADGRRTQVWRMSENAIKNHSKQTLNNLPDIYKNARGYHIGIHPNDINFDFLDQLARQGSLVSVEPFKPARKPPLVEDVRHLLRIIEIFSPNLMEASSLIGPNEPMELLKSFLDLGGKVVSIRMGSHGSLVADVRTGKAIMVPSVPVLVVDPVGAGNAYCGGFLVGWAQTGDLATAGLYGAVAASFLVEQIGIPILTIEIQKEAQRRLAQIRQNIQILSIR